MAATEKLLAQVNVRLPEETMAAIDEYVREREVETRLPLSRSIMIREILLEWAACRARTRLRETG